jgi:hypothetical protein
MQGVQARKSEKEKLPEVERAVMDRLSIFPEKDIPTDTPEYLNTSGAIFIEQSKSGIKRLLRTDKTDWLIGDIIKVLIMPN